MRWRKGAQENHSQKKQQQELNSNMVSSASASAITSTAATPTQDGAASSGSGPIPPPDAYSDSPTHIAETHNNCNSPSQQHAATSSFSKSYLPQLDESHSKKEEKSTTNATTSACTTLAYSPPPGPSSPTSLRNGDDDEDPGLDHAIPDDPSCHPNSSIVWSPQNTQSTCEFTHTISNYSSKRESGCKKAEYSNTTIDSFGNRWRLIVYVNGNGRASNHHLSLFLQVADADDLPFGWKKAVSYVLTLEHPNETNMGYAKRNPDKTFKLCPKAIDWGWSQFITSDRIQQDGYIQNDSLTVRASVTVKSSSISIDPEDAELYLKCAVEEGNAEAVEACLAQGASVNCQFKDDLYTPLHTACSSSASDGSLDVLNLLLKRGADGNACNKWRETPLLIAANNGHKAAVEALLTSGADPSMCSEAGWSALTFAAHKGYDDIVSLLLKAGAPRNCRVIEDLSTPLHKACAGNKDGHLSAVKQLLDVRADVHALNKWRETPLLTAANHGQAAAVEALLHAGADPCRCTDTGWSPLSIAAYKGHDDVVELLLEQGAPTEEEDPTLSALLQAATKGLPHTVELLLRHGADHTVTTKKGDTALSILVEQNHLDAAVEMVTEYKASVPRCSRDRKKVQRARLLINLQIKKQQKEEGAYWNDDSDQDDSDEGSNSALHDLDDSNDKFALMSSNKKQKKGKESANAENKAKAAADALLLELEQEDAKALQDEASAVSKRNKKKKKKERERHLKQEQEKVRKEKEEKEAGDRAETRRIKEGKDRKVREAKAKKQKEQEMKEAADRQKKTTARQNEKKRIEHETRQQEIREKERLEQEKRQQENAEKERLGQEKKAKKRTAKKIAKQEAASALMPQNGSTRGWEIGNEQSSEASRSSNISVQNSTNADNTMKATVEDELEDMANGVVGFLGFDDSASSRVSNDAPMSTGTAKTFEAASHSASDQLSAEPAPVALLRYKKVIELLRSANSANRPLASINAHVVQTIIYKWIVRASYDSSPFLDPLIPSWTDKYMLVAFIQRQLISESRKASNGVASNIELLKEAGSFLAELCLSLASDVAEFRKSFNASMGNSSDSAINMIASEFVASNGDRMIGIDSNDHSKVNLSVESFQMLRHRFVGPATSFLTSVFALKMRYDTFKMILSGSDLDCQLPTTALAALRRELKVTLELWTDPFSVFRNNNFCGIFPDVDCLFGGCRPFAEKNHALEEILCKEGGSVAVLPSLDSTTASFLTKRILDILESTEGKGIPLSFALFLPMQAFRDLTVSPNAPDLKLLDSRLLLSHRGFICRFETLHPGQHIFQKDTNGQARPSKNGSIMLILQNDSGRSHFPVSDQAESNIVRSLSAISSNDGFQPFVADTAPPAISASPIAPHQNLTDFGASDTMTTRNNGSRRSRFFDLVDDGEDSEDDFANLDANLEGMLNDLDIGIVNDVNVDKMFD